MRSSGYASPNTRSPTASSTPLQGPNLFPHDPWEEYATVWQRRRRQPREKDDPEGPRRNNPRELPPYEELLWLAPKLQAYEPDSDVAIMGEVEFTEDRRKRILAGVDTTACSASCSTRPWRSALRPVWERDAEGDGQLHPVAHAWQRTGAGWIHGSHRYLHVSEVDLSLLGQSVAVDRYRELRARPARGMLGGLRLSAEQAAMLPRSMLETIGPAGGVVRRPLSGGGLEVAPFCNCCWRYHFPTRAEWRTPRWPLPSPQSEEFWRSYGEPLMAIIDAAGQLGWIMQVIKAQTPKYATQPSRGSAAG